ncbi:MAG TPA: hypothetical protein PK878_14965 [bacterium]|nr:hypothetical protein [Candidatus Omnitrophota bacterium]HOJ61582.1 hypothetical protein [bacterium]HOL95104.1 hypothetical protein [bacterium]HPP00406.1 hypothetical protein [bacterium]HXK94665.1 hypothetical protein [bacterium]
MSPQLSSYCKTGLFLALTAVLCLGGVPMAPAAPVDESILRVEIQAKDVETVKISVPLSIMDTVYKVLPKDILRICRELKLTPDVIRKEFAQMEGEDIVRITGEENIRVWIEPVTPEKQKDLGFVRVFVKEHDHEVNVCVPRGLVELVGQVIKGLGLVDKHVELPKELTELHVVHETNDSEEN